MVYILEDTSLKYLLDELPKSVVPELWTFFEGLCNNNGVISERETQKTLAMELVNEESLAWLDKHKTIFSTINEREAITLGEMMQQGLFSDYEDDSRIIERRLPEGIPFVLAMAKARGADATVVYRKKARNSDIIEKICKKEKIVCVEVEAMLLQLKTQI